MAKQGFHGAAHPRGGFLRLQKAHLGVVGVGHTDDK